MDPEKRVSMIEAAIEKKVDAIVVSAASSDGVIPAIKKAREAGIKIVNSDTRISDTSVIDAFVGGDDVVGAYKARRYICEQLGAPDGTRQKAFLFWSWSISRTAVSSRI